MKFSVDAHAIGQHLTGNEVYVRNLLIQFGVLDPQSDFIAYLSDTVNGSAASVPNRFRTRSVSSNPFVRLGLDLNRELRQDRPDLLHVQYTAPLFCPVPIVVMVHDISFLKHPEYFPWSRALQLRTTVGLTVHRAVKVLTPSEFSRREILNAYKVDPANVEAIPHGLSSSFHPVDVVEAKRFVAARFQITRPFVLTVGDLQPRKNHIGLIQAFEQLLDAEPDLPHNLVLVGQNTWFANRVTERARTSKYADRIQFTGFVNDQDLLYLYNASDLMAFPSFYEGFGLPVLEAMACGRTVVCSNTSALPEVAGNAAILFDPNSISDMRHALQLVLTDPAQRSRLERLALQRAALFTWERTARRTLEIYYQVAGKRPVQQLAPASVTVDRP